MSPRGSMIRVMATGVFDIIHRGHLHFLKEAKSLGDELVVVVARDSTARKFGKEPIMDEETRLSIVRELKPVDRALLGLEGDIFQIVKDVRPDIVALGYDQHFDEEEIKRGCESVGVNASIVRLSRLPNDNKASSTNIRKRLLKSIEEVL